MIQTRLAGGLGNQLFQFAASIAISKIYNSEIFLYTEGLKKYAVHRDFGIDKILRINYKYNTYQIKMVLFSSCIMNPASSMFP